MYVGYSFNIGLVYITILVIESYMLVAVRKWSGLRYNIGNGLGLGLGLGSRSATTLMQVATICDHLLSFV